ncbi:Satratoxin biosynthesis SC1 cluster 4-like protein [Cladobotryum mycophilum]|uniref:Satratoxin biosynthesis SC1 cluster 4-like protein n=1 Tax=Cladobotryum mycophilum TaxID=491253 RepID=A0ABR0SNY6_9HYPO
MKWNGLLGFLLAVPFVNGQQKESSTTPASHEFQDLVAALPHCAIQCMAPLLQKSSCAIGDLDCMCANRDFEEKATVCVRASCKLSEALVTKNLTEVACHRPIRDKSASYTAMNITTGVLAVIFALARLIFKQFFSCSQMVGPDDIIIVGAVMLGAPGIIVNQHGLIGNGLGKDVWTLPFAQLPDFAMYFYIMEIIYITEISLIKLSLSVFYLYVFPGGRIRRLLIGTAIFNVCFGIAFVITGVFQCTPVSFYWTQYLDNAPHGKCIDLNTFAWAHAAAGVAIDVWMIALPISQIRRLDLHWKKKIGVTFMFLIGTFVTVISLLRLKSVIYFANLINPTWDQWNVAWWSTMEVNIGIICTCLPTCRAILVRMFPNLLNTKEDGRSAICSQHLDTRIAEERGICSMELPSASTTVNDTKSAEKTYESL